MNHQEISDRINAEVKRCMDIANLKYGKVWVNPFIDFNVRGAVAGIAAVKTWTVRLNRVFLESNPEEMIEQTLPHEIAHLIDFALHPENFTGKREIGRSRLSGEILYKRVKRQLHGRTWQTIMRQLGKNPTRCHQMDTTFARVRIVKRHDYKCPTCGYIFSVGGKQNAKLARGVSYALKRCGHRFNYAARIGIAQQTTDLLAARRAAK